MPVHGSVNLKTMEQMRRIIALLLLAWLPAVSSHGLLQYWGLIHQFHAAHGEDSHGSGDTEGSHEHHGSDHDAADGNCLLASTHVDVPAPQQLEFS